MGECLDCGWHAGEHRNDCPAFRKDCKYCGKIGPEPHHAHCPTNAGSGEIEIWQRGYDHGRVGKPRSGYGPHYNLGYLRGKAELEIAVAEQPPGW